MDIRAARPADVPRLVDLLVGGAIRPSEDPGNLAPYRAALQEIIDDPDATVLVAEEDGEMDAMNRRDPAVVGMCQVITFRHLQHQGGLCGEIESVHVDERYRSHGIGGVLLAAAVDWARSRGCYRVQLTSNKTRIAAHRFYLRHGFEASHEGFKLYL
jgi:GNAT superfamily N-acetyltransferase